MDVRTAQLSEKSRSPSVNLHLISRRVCVSIHGLRIHITYDVITVMRHMQSYILQLHNR